MGGGDGRRVEAEVALADTNCRSMAILHLLVMVVRDSDLNVCSRITFVTMRNVVVAVVFVVEAGARDAVAVVPPDAPANVSDGTTSRGLSI